jgi:hypothetical protein
VQIFLPKWEWKKEKGIVFLHYPLVSGNKMTKFQKK